jgi:murein peptide amidase A
MPPEIHHEILGQSSQGLPVEAHRLTKGPVNLLLLGGVHGDEPEGYYLVERFVREGAWKELEGQAALWVLPRLNPDGCKANERTNGRGVDLNRNMPTKDWTKEARAPRYHPGAAPGSEVETKILMAFIDRLKPRCIISAHSWDPVINYNGPCRKLAEVMATYNQYSISDDIGYPTPGSLGTWSGWERKIPTITLEVERGSSNEKIWKTHSEALAAGLIFASLNEDLGK